ncbi:MAG: ATP-grasp domain-containing protein [Acidobacteria bacterium]|nr:ATP-grasp domain-containing protein [Acidobacteriota bacterium]
MRRPRHRRGHRALRHPRGAARTRAGGHLSVRGAAARARPRRPVPAGRRRGAGTSGSRRRNRPRVDPGGRSRRRARADGGALSRQRPPRGAPGQGAHVAGGSAPVTGHRGADHPYHRRGAGIRGRAGGHGGFLRKAAAALGALELRLAAPVSTAPRLLIANRGEIARRILRTARARGCRVAVVSTAADRGAPVRDEVDQVFEVPGFLDGDAIVAAATGWDARLLHPGYGFLSESASFAAAVEAAGVAFVGPTAESMRLLGDKEAARRTAVAAGVPVLPSLGVDELAPEPDPAAAVERAGVGFPCAVKAAAGGGGIGIRVVRRPEALAEALSVAASEARGAFGDDRVYVERWLDRPRHVEIQVLGDGQGAGIHLGERECSVQRRRQKLLEWAPGFGISADLRAWMGEAALRLVIASRYRGAGTVEFLLEEDGTFHFLEVNTRLQVEHPVTEEIYGVDLVDAQLEIANGSWPAALPAPVSRAESFEPRSPCGAAFEARIVAESPRDGFAPSPGRLRRYREPEADGVRVDSGVVEGSPVPPGFDSLLAKVIASGDSHAAAAARLGCALEETVIHGVETNASLMISVLRHPDLLGERVHAGWLEERIEETAASRLEPEVEAFLHRRGVPDSVAEAVLRRKVTESASVFLSLGHPEDAPRVEPGSRAGEVLLSGPVVQETGAGKVLTVTATPLAGARALAVTVDGETLTLPLSEEGEKATIQDGSGEIRAPLAGQVIRILDAGTRVEKGDVVAVIESMKMHWEIRSPVAGVVTDPNVTAGEPNAAGVLLLHVSAI